MINMRRCSGYRIMERDEDSHEFHYRPDRAYRAKKPGNGPSLFPKGIGLTPLNLSKISSSH